jgi:hypothetical protein
MIAFLKNRKQVVLLNIFFIILLNIRDYNKCIGISRGVTGNMGKTLMVFVKFHQNNKYPC